MIPSKLTKDAFLAKHQKAYMEEGYNKSQARSLAWMEFFILQEMKFGLGYNKRYDCYCKDCGKGHVFGASESMGAFIRLHRDHKTRTIAY